MHNTRKINDEVFWIGANDKRLALFESVYPLPKGVSYNSYLVLDEKTILLDLVDKAVGKVFFENLNYLLGDRTLDFVVVNHVEPDHCAPLGELVLRYPEIKIIGIAKTFTMLKQFFDFDVDKHAIVVKEGDTLSTGRHTFAFYTAAMVHWPEVMVTYDQTDKYLYSADAFGTFGTLNGNIFADEVDFERDFLEEARRYYTNIVGKYGVQVQSTLKKAATLDISMILPLHGPIWRKNLSYIIEKYHRWSTYTAEEQGVLIAYSSVFGNTENAANILATRLAEMGIKNIAMYDVSVTDHSFVLAEAFRFSHIVFASTTYNMRIFSSMEAFINDIVAHNLSNRTVAIIENGSWAAIAGKLMREALQPLKNTTYIESPVSIKSSVKADSLAQINDLANAIFDSFPKKHITTQSSAKTDPISFFKIHYGLFILSAEQNEKPCGCIINTVMQLTDEPKQIVIAVNKLNFTHQTIAETGRFNVSTLSQETTFDMIEKFGFHSSRDTDKFATIKEFCEKSENGLIYVTKNVNSFFSCEVISMSDFGTHTLFVAKVTESKVLSDTPSLSYQYYFDHIKPKPVINKQHSNKKIYVCSVCGYVEENYDELPHDYICPLCKHSREVMILQE